jgi:hypothetical protein
LTLPLKRLTGSSAINKQKNFDGKSCVSMTWKYQHFPDPLLTDWPIVPGTITVQVLNKCYKTFVGSIYAGAETCSFFRLVTISSDKLPSFLQYFDGQGTFFPLNFYQTPLILFSVRATFI